MQHDVGGVDRRRAGWRWRGLVALAGAMLPREHRATRKARYRVAPEALYAVLAGPPDWRTGVKSFGVLADEEGRGAGGRRTRTARRSPSSWWKTRLPVAAGDAHRGPGPALRRHLELRYRAGSRGWIRIAHPGGRGDPQRDLPVSWRASSSATQPASKPTCATWASSLARSCGSRRRRKVDFRTFSIRFGNITCSKQAPGIRFAWEVRGPLLMPAPLPLALLFARSATDRLVRSMFDDTFAGIHQLAWFDWAMLIPYFARPGHPLGLRPAPLRDHPHLFQAPQEGHQRAAEALRATAAASPSSCRSITSATWWSG